MKNIKKFLAALVALTMAMMLALPAFAVGSNTITITNDKDGYTYAAYQVFAGTYSDGVLSDVTWGSGIDKDAADFTADLKTLLGAEVDTATKAAEAMAKAENASKADDFAKFAAKYKITSAAKTSTQGTGNYTITGLDDGYYMVENTVIPAGGAYTKFVLQVLGSVTVTPKTDVPSVIKKVKENSATTAADYAGKLNDAADYNIGDAVPFRLVGTVPDMSNYTSYKYAFNDTASAGLTLPANTGFTVYYVPSSAGTAEAVATDTALTSTSTGAVGITPNNITISGQTATISFTDLKVTLAGKTGGYIVVDYSATLNANAVVATADSLLGNPNAVTLTYSNNPNGEGEGTTPKDEVVVFTYTLPMSKVDGSNNALTGAEFALFADKDAATAAVTSGSTVAALKFTGSAGSYVKAATEGSATLQSAPDGTYTLKGLDTGTYYLVEMAAPATYNKLDAPVKIEILPTLNTARADHIADVTNDQLTALTIKQNDTATTPVKIENHKGATLPSTGGMGTTLFTIIGLVLMGGAGVLLVAKRRTNK